MKLFTATLLAFALLFSQPPGYLCQTATPTPTQNQDEEIVSVNTAEVMLDAVVRDKRGLIIKDLTADDFEIYEDGKRQQVSSFRLITPEVRNGNANSQLPDNKSRTQATGTGIDTRNAKRNPRLDSASGVGAVAMVFDRLSLDARKQAREAALAYVAEGIAPDNFVAVFAINQTLQVLQHYTGNAELVRRSINGFGERTSSGFTSNSDQIADLNSISNSIEDSITGGAASATTAGRAGGQQSIAEGIGSASIAQQFVQATQRALETTERLERDQQGYATTNSLLAVVNSVKDLPGRKAVLFFSEGLQLTPNVLPHFRAIISSATKAGVSIYTVDAAGLRTEGLNDLARREINAMGARRIRQNSSNRDVLGAPMMRELERNEDLLRANPQSGLGQLAEETGGFMVADTNNTSERLRRIDEELRTYYVMTYMPQNAKYDGSFRRISLKLKRSGAEVQYRQGYYAINTAASSPVLAYEVPVLAMLSSSTRPPSAFQLRAVAMNFPESNRLTFVPVMVEIPASAVTYISDKKSKTYSSDFTIVVLIKDQTQQVASKLSQRYVLTGALENLAAAQKREILFYREADLAPGRYTIEAAAYDAPLRRHSLQTSTLEVPETSAEGLRLSSISIIKRGEQLTAIERPKNNPFQYGDVLIYPNLGEPVSKTIMKQVPIFFTAYTAREATAATQVLIQLSRQGRALSEAKGALPKPDANGHIQYATTLPIEALEPGVYELRVTISDGKQRVERAISFDIKS
jgi:VWFA-related protein